MLQRWGRVVGLGIGLSVWCGSAAPARATPPQSALSRSDVELAERYSALAFEAYGRKEYAAAVALYQQALATLPSADMLYNIARIYDLGLNQPALAIDYYERYVAHAGALPPRMRVARERVALLTAAEQASRLALRAARPVPAAAHRTGSGIRTAALVAGGAGVVGLGLGVGFGLSAQAQAETWQEDCNGNACTSQRGVDAAEAAREQARIATIGVASGGALLALSVVFWLMDSSRSEESAEHRTLHVSPAVSDSALGCAVSGNFW